MWLAKVKESYGDNLEVEWKPFSLDQTNSKEGPEWKAWEQPDGLLALRAGEAARRQGREGFEAFHIAILKARHEERKDLSDLDVMIEAARGAGLDLARFQEDLVDNEIRELIGESHTKAVEEYGIFGVPTFLFSNGLTAYLKTYQPPPEEAVELFEALNKLMGKWGFVGEVKRPQPPWPKGLLSSA